MDCLYWDKVIKGLVVLGQRIDDLVILGEGYKGLVILGERV